MCSIAWLTATIMSVASARPTSCPRRRFTVISAMLRCFSTVRMTLLLKFSPRILVSLPRPDSTSSRTAGVISYCLPKYSTVIELPPRPSLLSSCLLWLRRFSPQWRPLGFAPCRDRLLQDPIEAPVQQLVFNPALVGARDAHVFPVLGYRAASDLDALRLEDAGDLLVG